MRGFISQFAAWVDNRTGLQTAISHFLLEDIPASAGWPHVFGSVALFLLLVQSFTGILLALNYAPTAGEAYSSLAYIVRQVAGGRLIHGLHHWGASVMIIVVVLHMAQVFIYGAFRKPREATWMIGVLLLLLTLAFGLTGYLLPWDNKAYWGTMVTIRIATSVPFVGPFLARLAGAGEGIGSLTFARFYALHTLVLPTLAIGLTAVHVYLVRRHGITPNAAENRPPQKFYPNQLFRDACTVFVAFICLFLAAAFLDAPLERMADPTDTEYVPRPEWYFLFVFQLLKILPGRLELLATVVLPTIAIAGLTFLPFLHRVNTRVLRGKIQSACVVVLALCVWAALTSAAGWTAPHARQKNIVSTQEIEWARNSPEVISGSGFFRSLHCDSCHDLIVGTPKPGPTLGLSGIQHTRDWVLAHLSEESKGHIHGTDAPSLSIGQRNTLLVFIASLKPQSLHTLSDMSPEFINGAQVFVNNACASCHKVNGVGGDIGPSLNGLTNRHNVGWVAAHFVAPRKLSPGSVMPPYHFSDKDERDLIGYLFSLSQ